MLHLHLQNENEQRPVQKSPFRNRSRCMRKRGVYDAIGAAVFAGDSACCWMLVTVLLDAAAPGGASSNRRLGVDTAPGAPPHQPPLPRVIRHPIGRSRTGLRPPWVKRERERERELGGLRSSRSRVVLAQGLSCTADCNGADCGAEYSPHLPFLISSSLFATALLMFHRFYVRYQCNQNTILMGKLKLF